MTWNDLIWAINDIFYFYVLESPNRNSFFNENTEAEMSLIFKNMLRNVPEPEIFFRILLSNVEDL